MAETLEICQTLRGFDYFNVVAGTSASLAGAVHIVPPMAVPHAYTAPFAAALKAVVRNPVIVTGRINQPQIAETIIASGQADVCGMTRAMICDPDMPAKAKDGRVDDIRACIACNQACIGHFHKGTAISCIQHPETGRELTYGEIKPARTAKRILVAGGGPAGMKAAAVLAARGHRVTLCEAGVSSAAKPSWHNFCPTVPSSAASSRTSHGRWSLQELNFAATLQSIERLSLHSSRMPSSSRPVPAPFGRHRGRDSAHCVDAW